MRRLHGPAFALMLLGCGSNQQEASQPGASGSGGAASGGSSGTTSGGSSGAATGGGSGSSSGGASGMGGSGGPRGGSGPFVPPTCETSGTRPSTAPDLQPGEWANITPPGVGFEDMSVATQGMTMDPCNPWTIYVGVVVLERPGGLFRSTDGGGTWTELGNFEMPMNVRVDPRDPLHMYVADGLRGATNGFWISKDGGETWYMPEGFRALADNWDLYHCETDPADFNHVLLTWHSGWDGGDSSVFESFDGGETWDARPLVPGPFAGGYNVWFLYNPVLGIGDNSTWLFGTQGKGFWRTTNAGETWTQVTEVDMQHGGGTIHYTEDGTLYASAASTILRSRDNGVTWTSVAPVGGYLSVIGDGNFLYTGKIYGPTPYYVAPLDDDTNWTPYGGSENPPLFQAGPFEMALDKTNGILYSANTTAGVFALKIAE